MKSSGWVPSFIHSRAALIVLRTTSPCRRCAVSTLSDPSRGIRDIRSRTSHAAFGDQNDAGAACLAAGFVVRLQVGSPFRLVNQAIIDSPRPEVGLGERPGRISRGRDKGAAVADAGKQRQAIVEDRVPPRIPRFAE